MAKKSIMWQMTLTFWSYLWIGYSWSCAWQAGSFSLVVSQGHHKRCVLHPWGSSVKGVYRHSPKLFARPTVFSWLRPVLLPSFDEHPWMCLRLDFLKLPPRPFCKLHSLCQVSTLLKQRNRVLRLRTASLEEPMKWPYGTLLPHLEMSRLHLS